MSRETQTSTFNDGLNKDLTPMLTPNTVMTDCLNGTIITYNGNEFALQNDLGNYKFNHGHLNQGFVPVGIKEHANILYIISYNPVTDEVEVGSFPSMKTIYSSGINTGKERDFSIELLPGFNLFTKLSQDSGLKMISDLNDDFLLNPGDKYMLSKTGQDDKFDDWAHISTYVFTENQKIYNIDKYITYSSSVNINDSTWNIVNWDVPGYISVKMLPHVMDEFNCYVTEFNSESADIHVQSIWNGNIYSKYIESIKGRIGYIFTTDPSLKYKEWLDSKTDNNNKDKLNTKKNYGNAYDVIHNTLSVGYTVEEGKNISISIIPYLEVDDDKNEGKYKILYDQFTTVLSLNPSEYTTNEIAKNIFNYYVNDKYLTLSYDVDSKINSNVYYEIYRWVEGSEKLVKNGTWEDVNYMGQNIAIIEYENNEINKDKENVFDKEDVYWLKLWINKSDEKADFEAPIYVSEVSNYYHRLYDHYWGGGSDKFCLDAARFAVAASRTLKLNIDLSTPLSNKVENYDPDDVGNMFAVKVSENSNELNKTKTFTYGTKYNIPFTSDFVKPKNQKGDVGRMWSGLSVTEIKNLELKDDKNKPVVCDNDNTSMNIEVLSSTTIKTYPEGSADLQVANPDTEIKMSDDYVHTNKYVYYDPSTGRGSINRGFFVFADDDNNYTYSTFKDNIEFTISGPDNIEINVFGKKCWWDGKKWDTDSTTYSFIHAQSPPALPNFKKSGEVMMNVNNMINNPALFVTYNYSHEDKNRELYYYTDTEEYDTINGFGWPKGILNSEWSIGEKTYKSSDSGNNIQHLFIGAKNPKDEYPIAIFPRQNIYELMFEKDDDNPGIKKPVVNEQKNKHGGDYMLNVICDYILCTAAIRYCKDTIFKRYYKLGYKMETNHVKSVKLRSLSCDAIADYEYTTSNANNKSGLAGQINNLNKAMKTVIEVDQDMTLTLDNNNLNTDFNHDYNSAIDEEFNKKSKMASIVPNKMYIIPELSGAKDIIGSALNAFGYSGKYITGSDETLDYVKFRDDKDGYYAFRLNKYTIH